MDDGERFDDLDWQPRISLAPRPWWRRGPAARAFSRFFRKKRAQFARLWAGCWPKHKGATVREPLIDGSLLLRCDHCGGVLRHVVLNSASEPRMTLAD